MNIEYVPLEKAIWSWNQNSNFLINPSSLTATKTAGFGKNIFAFHNHKTGWKFQKVVWPLACCPVLQALIFKIIRWLNLGYAETKLTPSLKQQLRDLNLIKGYQALPQQSSKPLEKGDKEPDKDKVDEFIKTLEMEPLLVPFQPRREYRGMWDQVGTIVKADLPKLGTFVINRKFYLSSPFNSQKPENLFYFNECLKRMSKAKIECLAIKFEPIFLKEEFCSWRDFYEPFNWAILICQQANRPLSEIQLFVAALTGDINLLQRCLFLNVNLLVRNASGLTPFHVALRCASVDFLKLYWEAIQFQKLTVKDGEKLFETENYSLLDFPKNDENLKWLLNCGIAIDVKRNYLRASPLEHYISESKPLTMIEQLIQKDPSVLLVLDNERKKIFENQYAQLIACLGSKEEQKALQLCQLIVKYNPEPMSPKIKQDISYRVLNFGHTCLLSLLPETDRLELEKTLKQSQEPVSFASLAARCKMCSTNLKAEMQRWNLAPEMISVQEAYKAYCLKHEVKKFLKQNPADKSAEAVLFAAAHKEFLEIYWEVTALSPYLNAFQAVANDIRHNRTNELNNYQKSRINKLTSLLGHQIAAKAVGLDTYNVWKRFVKEMRQNMAKAHIQIADLSYDKLDVTWAHGTRFMAVESALQSDLKIKASGVLMKEGIAPLTGEASEAIEGDNVTGISGMTLDSSWHQTGSRLTAAGFSYGAPTRLLISKKYATREESPADFAGKTVHRKLVFRPEESHQVIVAAVEALVQGKQPTEKFQSKAFWFDFKRAIMRLRQTDAGFKEKYKAQYQQLSGLKSPAELEECLKLWNSAPPRMLTLANTFPVMLASTNLYYHNLGWGTDHGERVVDHPMELGGHIQLLATEEADLKKAQEACEKAKVRNVKVISFEALQLLEMRRMILDDAERNYLLSKSDVKAICSYSALVLEQHKKELPQNFVSLVQQVIEVDAKEDVEKKWLEKFKEVSKDQKAHQIFQALLENVKLHKKLARNFHRDLLPAYATPYSNDPHYLNAENVTVPINSRAPFYGHTYRTYAAYKAAVDRQELLPRRYHGSGHCTRVLINAILQYNLRKSLGEKIETDLYFVGMTAGAHDIARADEGTDFWDRASAETTKRYVAKEDDNVRQVLYQAIAEKDPATKLYSTQVQQIVHDSDNEEFPRVMQDPKLKDFRRSELQYYGQVKKEIGDKLVDEAIEFILATDKEAVLKYLEFHSKNYLIDMLKIFKHLHTTKNCFPQRSQYLAEALAILVPEDPVLPKELLEALSS